MKLLAVWVEMFILRTFLIVVSSKRLLSKDRFQAGTEERGSFERRSEILKLGKG
jgi:hypothetical protein